MKAIKHMCTAVTLHVRYKMTGNQLINFSVYFFVTQWNFNVLSFAKYST